MPYKKSDMRGDLYLLVSVEFPKDGWLQDAGAVSKIQELLPPPGKPIEADTIDEVEYDEDADIDGYGGVDEANGGNPWVDEDEEEAAGHPQCAQQ